MKKKRILHDEVDHGLESYKCCLGPRLVSSKLRKKEPINQAWASFFRWWNAVSIEGTNCDLLKAASCKNKSLVHNLAAISDSGLVFGSLTSFPNTNCSGFFHI